MPRQIVDTGALTHCMASYIDSAEVTLPPGELMYRWIGLPGSSLSRKSSCAVTRLATSSVIWSPRKMMRSRSSRE